MSRQADRSRPASRHRDGALPGRDDGPVDGVVDGPADGVGDGVGDDVAERVADLRLLLPALVAWAAGAAALSWPAGLRLWAAAAAAAAAGLAASTAVAATGRRSGHPPEARFRRRSRAAPGVGVAAAAASLVLLASGAQAVAREAGPVTRLAQAGATASVVGTVTREPVTRPGSRGREATVVLTIRVSEVTGRGQVARVSSPVLVVGDARWRGVQWRQQVAAQGRFASAAPGDAAVAVFRPVSGPQPRGQPGAVARAAEHLRAGLRAAAAPLPTDAQGLLPALVIGDTSRTPQDLTDAMLATGMTHLSAVSGSNVAIVLAAALGLAALCGLPRRARPVLALVVLAGFVVLARPEPSVIRAAAMGAIGLIGLSRSRRAAGLPALAGAVLALLVIDPWLARSYGFALSTLATLGLLLFTRSWGRAAGRLLPRRLRSWGPALAIPVAAQAMCAPVVVLLQGSVSTVGVLANLLAAPLVAPATVAGVAAAVLAPLSQPVATVLCWAGAVPTLGIARIARVFAAVPGGMLPWPDGPPGALLLSALTTLALLAGPWLVHRVRWHPVLAAGAFALVAAVSVPTSAATWPPPGWRMVACDVGQGDALVLATTPGRAVLVDAGPEPAAVDRCLRRLGVAGLDAVVLSHFHADHVAGLPGALRGRPVREILASPVRDPPHQWVRVRDTAAAHGIPLRELYAGDRLQWAGLTAQVWWPARRIAAGSVPNNGSVVLALQSGGLDALLLGDVEREAAHAMLLTLRRDPQMAAAARSLDAVKTPHHGSANLDEALMAAVGAPVAVISVGADNDYGHPARAHLEVLRRAGSAVYRTDRHGDVALVVRGERVAVTWRRR